MAGIILDIKRHSSYINADKVKDICSPLFNNFEINFFEYLKGYYNGNRILLSSNKEWVIDYFESQHYLHEFMNYAHLYPRHRNFYNLWTDCSQNHKGCALWVRAKEKYKFSHMLSIMNCYDHYAEMFLYCGQEKNYHLSSVFLSNIDVFERFNIYFREEAKSLIESGAKDMYRAGIMPESADSNRWLHGAEATKHEEFNLQTPLKIFHLTGKFEGQSLTLRQMQCIKGIFEGLSYKQIARVNHISDRTVDYHMKEIRKMFNVRTKHELLEILEENDIFPMLKFV